MPYRSDKVKIAGTEFDLRRRISDDKAEAIRILSGAGFSQRRLADLLGCGRSTVQHVLNPRPRRRQVKRYPKEYRTEATRRCRARKNMLYNSGAIEEKNQNR